MCGFFTSKDIFSHRWINAEIDDSTDRRWVVHIKYVLGNYFLADLEGRLYAFELGKTKTLKHTLTRKYEFLNYDTSNYKPIDGDKLKALEILVKENSLPKINKTMFDVLSLLAKREKNIKVGEVFKGHDLKQLIKEIEDIATEELKKQKDGQLTQLSVKAQERYENLKTFLEELNTQNIITPVRKVTDFLDAEIKVTEPKFLADISTQHQRAEIENRIMTNRPIKGKTSLAKIMIVILIGGLVIGVAGYFLATGQLSHGFNLIPSSTSGGGSILHVKDIATTYPTPESLVEAIKSGKLTCSGIDDELKHMVNNPPGVPGTCP